MWSPPGDNNTPRRSPTLTFREYSATWLETRTVKGRVLRPRTKAHYGMLLDKHLLPAFGPRQLAAITPEMVDRWWARMADGAPTLRAHCYSLMRTIMESARTDRARLIAHNPCQVRHGGTTAPVVRPQLATLDELDMLTAAMPDDLQLMVLLAAWCALRFGELVELRRRDVDGNVIRVRRGAVRVGAAYVVGPPKSEAGVRDVTIPPHLLPLVAAHLVNHAATGGDGLLFPADHGGHLAPSTLYRHWYRARSKAGRDDLRFHDLRHTGAVLAAQTGATLAELKDRLGHTTVAAAMRYQHAAAGRDAQIADALSVLARRNR